MSKVAEMVRKGELDCNDQQLFFSTIIKGLLLHLTEDMTIRDRRIPHVIFNTGDDTMWLLLKEYDYSKEPYEVTNEQYIYNTTPRCSVNIGSVDILPDQLTNPYSRGQFQIEYEDHLYTLNADVRRMPVKINIELKYLVDTFTDMLELMQHIITKLAFIRTFKVVYMGQTLSVSYKIPDTFDGEHTAEMDGTTQDSKDRIVSITLEVESTLPVYSPKTVVDASAVILREINTLYINGNGIDTRDSAPWKGSEHLGER